MKLNRPWQRRLLLVGGGLGVAATVTALILNAFSNNLVFFLSPTQVLAGEAPQARVFRLGGLVEVGSVSRAAGSTEVSFVLTDTINRVPVRYDGALPDLFGENQGAIATGRLVDGRFVAEQVLAKHDENYMPPEVAATLADAAAITVKVKATP